MRIHNIVGPVAADLLRSRPPTAARNGLLTLLDVALEETEQVARRADLAAAARPLCSALGAADVRDVARALSTSIGRAPRDAERALISLELTTVCADALDSLGCEDLAPALRAWTDTRAHRTALPPYTTEAREERRKLAAALLTRAAQLGRVVADRTAGFHWKDAPPPRGDGSVDGRTLRASAGAWQRPEILGYPESTPDTRVARYPNRVGRVSAALAFARMRAALRAPAPDEWVTHPILLLAAVAESISPLDPTDPNAHAQAMRGDLAVVVRDGEPDLKFLGMPYIWKTLAHWGHSDSRKSSVLPLAWNLTGNTAWADVLVWAVCSAAARLSVASEREVRDTRTVHREPTWEDHLAAEWDKWESGAQSAWMLMQSGREPLDRTAFPGRLTPVLTDPATWPWQSERDPWADDEPGTAGGDAVTPSGARW